MTSPRTALVGLLATLCASAACALTPEHEQRVRDLPCGPAYLAFLSEKGEFTTSTFPRYPYPAGVTVEQCSQAKFAYQQFKTEEDNASSKAAADAAFAQHQLEAADAMAKAAALPPIKIGWTQKQYLDAGYSQPNRVSTMTQQNVKVEVWFMESEGRIFRTLYWRNGKLFAVQD